MSTVGGGVNIVRDGLVMYLDTSNTKSLADVPSQNLITYSQQFENWGYYQSSVSANTTTAPDGTTTADTNIETSGLTGWRGVNKLISGMTSGQTYTFSVYAKNFNGRNIQMAIYEYPTYTNWFYANFNLQSGTTSTISNIGTGVLTNSSVVSVGDGWYRCSISGYIPSATELQPYIMLLNSGNTTSYTGDGVSGVYLWGGQFEVGTVATTYIPTTTVPVSRIPTWTDISKGGNNGTLSSGFTYNYSNGGSLVFDGISNYVNCGNPANLQTFSQITLNTWIKFSGLDYVNNTGSLVTFIDKGKTDSPPSTPSSGFWFAYENRLNRNSFNYTCFGNTAGGYAGGVNNFASKSYTFTNGIWYNITATVNSSSQGNLFINGVQQGTPVTFSNLNLSNTTNNLQVGMYLSNNYFLNGNISQTQIYNRALSSTEVLQNYNAAKSKFGL